MSFKDGKMPASTDMVEFRVASFWEPGGNRTHTYIVADCLVCMQELGRVSYLNEAIKLWTDHQEDERAHRKAGA